MQKHFLLAFLFILLTPMSWAQSVISGHATDATTGEDLPFVNVRLTRPGQTKVVQGATTENGGTFTLAGVAAGDYTLTLSYVGYTTLRQDVTWARTRNPSTSASSP